MNSKTFTLSTDAIDANGRIDSRYTCDLDNSSPDLRWKHPPEDCKGFALILEDKDAPSGIFSHWVIYNIPESIHHLPAGIPPQDSLPNGIQQGLNSFGKLGYAGPCPPPGDQSHHYTFRLFALRELPHLGRRLRREEILHALRPYILAEAKVIGLYRRAVQRAG